MRMSPALKARASSTPCLTADVEVSLKSVGTRMRFQEIMIPSGYPPATFVPSERRENAEYFLRSWPLSSDLLVNIPRRSPAGTQKRRQPARSHAEECLQ